jgi:hypothetical protein
MTEGARGISRTGTIAVVAAVLLAICLVFSLVADAVRELRVKFARDQVETFDLMVSKAGDSLDGREIENMRRSVETYYPSGTKQRSGSDLDVIVEHARRCALERIDAQLSSMAAH